MTYDLDRTILELEAEARNADPAERRQIETELGLARAERETILAEQDGRISAEPGSLRRDGFTFTGFGREATDDRAHARPHDPGHGYPGIPQDSQDPDVGEPLHPSARKSEHDPAPGRYPPRHTLAPRPQTPQLV